MRLSVRVTSMLAATALATPVYAQAGATPANAVTTLSHGGPQGAQLQPSIQALQQTLIELQQLKLQLKQAHWNVSGTLFYPLHLELQEHKEGIEKYSDMVAERLLAIGVSADGRATTIVRTSRIPEYAGGFTDDAHVIGWFANYYKVVSDEIGQGIKATNDSDPSTSNLLQEVQGVIDKYQWQMRAFIQPTAKDRNDGATLNGGQPIAVPPAPAG